MSLWAQTYILYVYLDTSTFSKSFESRKEYVVCFLNWEYMVEGETAGPPEFNESYHL